MIVCGTFSVTDYCAIPWRTECKCVLWWDFETLYLILWLFDHTTHTTETIKNNLTKDCVRSMVGKCIKTFWRGSWFEQQNIVFLYHFDKHRHDWEEPNSGSIWQELSSMQRANWLTSLPWLPKSQCNLNIKSLHKKKHIYLLCLSGAGEVGFHNSYFPAALPPTLYHQAILLQLVCGSAV